VEQNLETQRVQEQVLTVYSLIEVKARFGILRNNCLFYTMLLFQQFHLIKLFRVNKSIVYLIFRVDSPLIEVTCKRH